MGPVLPLLLAVLASFLPAPCSADPDEAFSFRRIGLPQSGAARRITVQIALRPSAPPPAAPVVERAPVPPELSQLARRWGGQISKAVQGTRVSPALVLAVIAVESAGRPDALSHAGAQGLMQLMPGTAERFGVRDPFDPAQNIRGGTAYLDWLFGAFGGAADLALAGYNAGEGSVARHGGVPPFQETQAYVPKVLAAFEAAQGLCESPPVAAGAGCVLAIP